MDGFLEDVVQSHQDRVCIPAQELEMLAVSKGKALFHLAFVRILVLPIPDGLTGKEKPLVLQPQVSLGQGHHGSCPGPCCCSQYEVAALGQFLGDSVCACAPTSVTAGAAQNWLGEIN